MINDKAIRLNASSYLTIQEVEVISLLYRPLIKEKAALIYLSLFSLLSKNNLEAILSYPKLIEFLGLKEEEFEKEKDKLEAIGLLSSYEGEDDYLMLLKTPLSAKQFLSDGVLGMYLYSEIGDDAFKEVQKLFELPKIDKTKYKEVSKTFDQCFKTKDLAIDGSKKYLVNKKPNHGIVIENNEFDFDVFANLIAKTFLDGKKITNKFQSFITNIAYVYMFGEQMMEQIYNQSLNNSGYFDYQLCSKNARAKYKELHNGKLPALEEQKEENSSLEAKEELFTKVPIKQLMSSGAKEDVKTTDLEKVERLYQNFNHIPRSVINVCICYSISKCDGEIPPYQYFEKVLKSWIEKGISTFSQAVKETETQKETKGTKKKKKDQPEWLAEYQKHFEEGVEDL